jgi:hypothetical protein
MMRMYFDTADVFYLNGAKDIWSLYVTGGGMTKTYQNLNWWGRPDSWTEPCAIVDSLMLSLDLYRATEEEAYRTMAARIWHNGLAAAQRDNGGAGTDSIVAEGSGHKDLFAKSYEAAFCCSMRLAEGLWYISNNRELFSAHIEGRVTKRGRIYADGDILYAQVSGGAEAYAENQVEIDGLILSPLVKFYKLPKELIETTRQKILF